MDNLGTFLRNYLVQGTLLLKNV